MSTILVDPEARKGADDLRNALYSVDDELFEWKTHPL